MVFSIYLGLVVAFYMALYKGTMSDIWEEEQ